MEPSNNCHELIMKFEGCQLKAYKCPAGVWTIGYGHTGKEVVQGLTISQEMANRYLKGDVSDYAFGVEGLVDDANQNQFDALVSFAFNLGLGSLARSTLLKLHNRGAFIQASKEFARWNKAASGVLSGLTRRRKAEAELYMRGQNDSV